MQDFQIIFEADSDVSEEVDLALDYFDHFQNDGHDLADLMRGMLHAIAMIAEQDGETIQ